MTAAPRGPGVLVLAGSGEFRPPMVAVDREVLRHTPGQPPKVAILPTAAGLEDVTPWVRDGISHFSTLGCEVRGVRAVDRAGVEDPDRVAMLEASDLIYLSGGSPGYLVETLRASAAWQAIVAVWRSGGALAGSSAGAMAFGELTLIRRVYTDRGMPSHWEPGLGLIQGVGVIPHYDRLGPARSQPRVDAAPDGLVVLGIDEDTAIVSIDGATRVLGNGTVTVWRDRRPTIVPSGAAIPPDLVQIVPRTT
jgi:cyanophycinase